MRALGSAAAPFDMFNRSPFGAKAESPSPLMGCQVVGPRKERQLMLITLLFDILSFSPRA